MPTIEDGGVDGRAIVERELRLLSKIDHPNILKVHEAFEDEFKIYFVVDEMDGLTLFDRIMLEGRLKEERAATVSSYLSSIIKYLHKNGIILRNLRPENIMLEGKEISDNVDIKIVDLSLAVEKTEDWGKAGRNTQYDDALDKFITLQPIFRAPELFSKTQPYDEKVDMWSLGCIIFNMVMGVPPFYEQDESALINQVRHGSY